MAEQQTNLLPFYKGWDAYQALLIKAIVPLSSEQLALRVAPHLRSIGENEELSSFTRQWLIWSIIKHDLHHGGEVFFTLGTHHLETPDL